MLRLIVTLDGEVVVGLDADIGYVHTGFEKNFEQKTYWKGIPYAPRMDYVAFFANELAYVGAVEKLIGIEVPERAQWIRTLFAELNRIHSHLVYLGTSGVEMGAMSVFFYCLRERDTCSTCSRWRPACACTTATRSSAAWRRTCRRASTPSAASSARRCRADRRVPRPAGGEPGVEVALPRHRHDLGRDRDRDGPLGPNLRATGVPYDLRRTEPYLVYDQLEFDVVAASAATRTTASCAARKEMYESVRIIEQCLDKMPAGPVMAADRKYVLPPRNELHTSMESLIHHFKLVTEGFRVPPGQVYYPVESPRGEFGCYLVSDGGPKPWRVHFRAPSFVSLQVTAMMSVNRYVGDMIVVVGSLDGVMGEADR